MVLATHGKVQIVCSSSIVVVVVVVVVGLRWLSHQLSYF